LLDAVVVLSAVKCTCRAGLYLWLGSQCSLTALQKTKDSSSFGIFVDGGGEVERQKHSEDCSATAFRLITSHCNGAGMPLKNVLADPKPEPSAADTLGRIEGIEYLLPDEGWDTWPIIGNSDSDASASVAPPGTNVTTDQQAAAA
jgi:hypothetical protein